MSDPITAGGIRTYLACPRRYELAHRYDLDGRASRDATDDHLDVVRRAIVDALAEGATPDALIERALESLRAAWADHDEPFHSREQQRHTYRVLAASVRAHLDAVGPSHRDGMESLLTDVPMASLIGPNRPLEGRTEEGVPVSAPVDYITADGRAVIGVRLIETPTSLGTTRFDRSWEDHLDDQFAAHFDPADDTHDVATVGTLLETAIIHTGLRTWCRGHGLEGRVCRYVCVPVLTPWNRAVDWHRGTVDTSADPVDLTDAFLDHQSVGDSLEHRNETVETRLDSLIAAIRSGAFDPADRWSTIETEECPSCDHAICCQDAIAASVRHDG